MGIFVNAIHLCSMSRLHQFVLFEMFQVIVFADSLIPTVRKALCDPLPEVREAAARTFDNLHANIGQRALDDILPALLRQLVCSLRFLFFTQILLIFTHFSCKPIIIMVPTDP